MLYLLAYLLCCDITTDKMVTIILFYTFILRSLNYISSFSVNDRLFGLLYKNLKESFFSNRSKSDKWFNTPNMYKLIEDIDDVDANLSYNFPSQQSDKKTARWGSVKVPNLTAPTPQHPVTAGAYVLIGHQPPKPDKEKVAAKINPKELIENQKRVRFFFVMIFQIYYKIHNSKIPQELCFGTMH